MNNSELRTSSYKKQPAFDRLLAESDISSLRFLSVNYDNKLDYFKKNNSLDESDNLREYRFLQQRKKMIDEELTTRIMNHSATLTELDPPEFDSTNNIVYDGYNDSYSTVAFNENEDGYIIYEEDYECSNVDDFFNEDEEDNEKKSRKDIYKDWNYTNG